MDRARPRRTRGLIPAHAGKTLRSRRAGRRSRAHPRSRGENDGPRYEGRARRGSSPLTRGKRDEAFFDGGFEGLIPAHAGKTGASLAISAGTRAHPRSRGENRWCQPQDAGDRGSSPLTRGKQGSRPPDLQANGLIPAHAGKTLCAVNAMPWRRAHPRSRGENAEGAAHGPVARGSSPLTRGKQVGVGPDSFSEGLIPAHAGKTVVSASSASHSWAHPRSRGENSVGGAFAMSQLGSSPLTRGKPSAPRRPHARDGLIPTHAGKTQFPVRERCDKGAHPRSRGEN